MSDEQSQSPSNPPRKKWLDRLSHLFQGEPKDRHELVGMIQDAEERDVIDEEFQNLLAGKKSPKDALDAVVVRGNKLIADFRAANR